MSIDAIHERADSLVYKNVDLKICKTENESVKQQDYTMLALRVILAHSSQ
jgi:hypothetical protein